MSDDKKKQISFFEIYLKDIPAVPIPNLEWEFSPDMPTWLQTDSIGKDKARWYLTKEQGGPHDDPAYFIEIEPDAKSVLRVIAQVADKSWTDKGQLLETLMPVIRTLARHAE